MGNYLSKVERLAVDSLAAFISAEWPLAELKLFGSKATGVYDAESDLDILVLLPCHVSKDIRRKIIHKVFDINLAHETNISVLLISQDEWRNSIVSRLPIHDYVEEEGVPL